MTWRALLIRAKDGERCRRGHVARGGARARTTWAINARSGRDSRRDVRGMVQTLQARGAPDTMAGTALAHVGGWVRTGRGQGRGKKIERKRKERGKMGKEKVKREKEFLRKNSNCKI